MIKGLAKLEAVPVIAIAAVWLGVKPRPTYQATNEIKTKASTLPRCGKGYAMGIRTLAEVSSISGADSWSSCNSDSHFSTICGKTTNSFPVAIAVSNGSCAARRTSQESYVVMVDVAISAVGRPMVQCS